MRSEPLVIIGAVAAAVIVLAAIGLHVTSTPISEVTAVAAALAPIIGIVLAGRTQVFAKDTTEGLVKSALQEIPPADPVARAKEIVK